MDSIAVVRPKKPVATNGAAVLQEVATTYNPWFWITWYLYCILMWWRGPRCFACNGQCKGHVQVTQISFHAEYAAEQERKEQERQTHEQQKVLMKRISKKQYLCMRAEWDYIKYSA